MTLPLARPTWRERMSNLLSKRFLTILLLGQLLSLCITATTIFTTKLAQGDNPVSIPTTQSFLNYLVLGLVYTAVTIYKDGFRGWISMMRRRAAYCKREPYFLSMLEQRNVHASCTCRCTLTVFSLC
jgi:solute carrier family 35 protein F1/2